MSNQSDDDEHEAALAKMKQAEAVLAGIQRRLKACKEMVNLAKAGKSDASLSSIEQFQQKLLMEDCEARVILDEVRHTLAELKETRTAEESPLSSRLASSSGSEQQTACSVADSAVPRVKRQMTMANFLLVTSGDGKLRVRELFRM